MAVIKIDMAVEIRGLRKELADLRAKLAANGINDIERTAKDLRDLTQEVANLRRQRELRMGLALDTCSDEQLEERRREPLMSTSLDLQALFSPPNLGPPADLRLLVESIRAAAPLVQGDRITIPEPELAALRRACSPLGDRAELYWGRHRLTTAPTPDPSIVY